MTDKSPTFNAAAEGFSAPGAVAEILKLLDTVENGKGAYASKQAVLREALLRTARLTEELGKSVTPDKQKPNMNFNMAEQDFFVNANLMDFTRPNAAFIRYSKSMLSRQIGEARKRLDTIGQSPKDDYWGQEATDWHSAGMAASALGLAEMRITEVIYGVNGKRPLIAAPKTP